MNEAIFVPKVQVIDANGAMLGELSKHEALEKAQEQGLDLVQITYDQEVPICKIIDYGKFRYNQQKKQAQARRNQKVIVVKELQLRLTTEKNDLMIKLWKARAFLEKNHKVKFTMRLRYRELESKELIAQVFENIAENLQDVGKIETKMTIAGKQATMVIA